MRAHRLLAVAAVAVLGGGVAVAAVGRPVPVTPAAGTDARTAPRVVVTPDARPAVSGPRVATPRPAATAVRPATRPSPAASAVPSPLFPLPAAPAGPSPCPPPPLPPAGPAPKPVPPKVAETRLPSPLPVAAHRSVDLRAVSGKGMWLTVWPDSSLDAATVVARAKAAGLTQLWVRTGGTHQGWYGARFLTPLLPLAHRAGIAVVAWDFPTLSDPVADARRAQAALAGSFGGERIDGFSPDIETAAEGTFATPRRVAVYLSVVRAAAGDRPVVATVPRPTSSRLTSYPYRAQAPYVDAFAPMVYWSCLEPGEVTALAVSRLRSLGRPVHVVGQSYDMAAEGGRHGLPSSREIWRFLDVAKRSGAVGASLYVYSETRGPQWRALTAYPWPATHR